MKAKITIEINKINGINLTEELSKEPKVISSMENLMRIYADETEKYFRKNKILCKIRYKLNNGE